MGNSVKALRLAMYAALQSCVLQPRFSVIENSEYVQCNVNGKLHPVLKKLLGSSGAMVTESMLEDGSVATQVIF